MIRPMTKAGAAVLVSLLAAWPEPALSDGVAGEAPAEIEEFVYESGPYPRMLVLNLRSEADTGSSPWKAKVLEKLEKMELIRIEEETANAVRWRPRSQTESYIRHNMDMHYRVVDYSVVLGTLDVTIDSISRTGDRQITAKVSEVVFENRLYQPLLPLLPEDMKTSFEASERELTFQRRAEEWALVE